MNKNSPCAIKTKKKMTASLKELMKTNSFEKITVSDITEKCSIHRQTFYYHFQDRYELLDWLLFDELIEPFVTDFTLDNMYDKFKVMLETMNSDKRFYQNALKINTSDIISYTGRIAKEQVLNVVRMLGTENSVTTSRESEDLIIAEFFSYGIAGILINWAQSGMKESPEDMTASLIKLVEICKQISLNRS